MQAWRTRGQGLDSRDSFVTPRKAGVKSSNIIATPKQPLKLTPPTPNELPGSSNAAASIRKNLIELSRQEDPEPILPPNFGHHDTITRYIMEKYGTPVIFGRGFGWHNPLHVPQDDPKPQILPDTRPKFRPESILANPNPDPTPVINPSKIQSVCSDLPQRRPFQELNCNVPVGKSIDSIEIIDDRSALYCKRQMLMSLIEHLALSQTLRLGPPRKTKTSSFSTTKETSKVGKSEFLKVFNFPLLLDSSRTTDESASEDWILGFLKRNSSYISLREPEATSQARAAGFNAVVINTYYDKLDELYAKYKFTADKIWNCDETGVPTGYPHLKFSLKKEPNRFVQQTVSAERGINVTMLVFVSASGVAIPPVYFYPRKYANDDHYKNGHLDKYSNCTKDDPVLLIMDNHKSHTDYHVIKFAKENGIVLLTFPPHCSHELQPLDVTVFGPFKILCVFIVNDFYH
ncbi:Uncharacterized protein APZ42_031600 [Daphnia magna]|uniref:DDE-1 domain-containing protein n=1 Tax=Daphnia magna TaxID=35525 RepID=A0A164MQK2_9CRUS|nr:Uncharacterized protein APZ42_031600 [Daphnia magna]